MTTPCGYDPAPRKRYFLLIAVGVTVFLMIIVVRIGNHDALLKNSGGNTRKVSPEPPKVGILPVRTQPIVVRGRILDGKSEKPVPRARLLFHHPRLPRTGESIRHSLTAWYLTADGRGMQTLATSFRHDDQSEVAYDRPQVDVPALSESTSDDAGVFEIAI